MGGKIMRPQSMTDAGICRVKWRYLSEALAGIRNFMGGGLENRRSRRDHYAVLEESVTSRFHGR
ncbi:MAG TPA: hypothetical protein VFX02_01670 [Gammaproteobacteria bacterium]|nr:hypothetical protein [Gammaproteobacteria bacterium]